MTTLELLQLLAVRFSADVRELSTGVALEQAAPSSTTGPLAEPR